MKYRALDLFCGGGGSALGLIAAGFDVTGVDINPKNEKVYPGAFICADATEPPVDITDFDFVWASPPCQAFSIGANLHHCNNHPNLIPRTKAVLKNHPGWVIENVPGAPLRKDIVLTGSMVGLDRIYRKRIFETSFKPPLLPPPPPCPRREEWESKNMVTITKSMSSKSHFYYRKSRGLQPCLPKQEAAIAMGITISMNNRQIGEAVPPAYAKLIAEHFLVMRGVLYSNHYCYPDVHY